MTNVTCGVTAKKPGSAPRPTLVIDYGTILLLHVPAQISNFHSRDDIISLMTEMESKTRTQKKKMLRMFEVTFP